jgi:hypothetical protein
MQANLQKGTESGRRYQQNEGTKKNEWIVMKRVFFIIKIFSSRIWVRRFDTMQKVNRFSSGGIFCFIVFSPGIADGLLGIADGLLGFADELLGVLVGEVSGAEWASVV